MRTLLAASAAGLVAAAFFAFACGTDSVIIGIESDSGTTTPQPLSVPVPPPPPPLGLGGMDSGLFGPSLLDDAGYVVCLPDAGCPFLSVCEWPADAACGTSGLCFSNGLPIPPPLGFAVLDSFEHAPRDLGGYSKTPPDCDDGGEPGDAASALPGVADAHGD